MTQDKALNLECQTKIRPIRGFLSLTPNFSWVDLDAATSANRFNDFSRIGLAKLAKLADFHSPQRSAMREAVGISKRQLNTMLVFAPQNLILDEH